MGMLIDILGGVGDVLDTPGRFTRTALAGRNPFAAVFDPSKGVSGRDLLQQYGMVGENQDGLDGGDIGGFLAEMVLDPTNLIGGGLLAKVMGKASKARAANRGIEAANDARLTKFARRQEYMKPRDDFKQPWQMTRKEYLHQEVPTIQANRPMTLGDHEINDYQIEDALGGVGRGDFRDFTRWTKGFIGDGDVVQNNWIVPLENLATKKHTRTLLNDWLASAVDEIGIQPLEKIRKTRPGAVPVPDSYWDIGGEHLAPLAQRLEQQARSAVADNPSLAKKLKRFAEDMHDLGTDPLDLAIERHKSDIKKAFKAGYQPSAETLSVYPEFNTLSPYSPRLQPTQKVPNAKPYLAALLGQNTMARFGASSLQNGGLP